MRGRAGPGRGALLRGAAPGCRAGGTRGFDTRSRTGGGGGKSGTERLLPTPERPRCAPRPGGLGTCPLPFTPPVPHGRPGLPPSARSGPPPAAAGKARRSLAWASASDTGAAAGEVGVLNEASTSFSGQNMK